MSEEKQPTKSKQPTKEKPIDSVNPRAITNATTSDAIKSKGPAPIQIASPASDEVRRKEPGNETENEPSEIGKGKDSDSF